jgi:hypothetical protein
MADLTENSYGGGVLAVTIAGSPANIRCGTAGTADADGAKLFTVFPVRSCLVQLYSGTGCYLALNRAATAAATSWKIGTTPVAIPIDDLAKLNFIGTAADVVQILYRV